MQLVGGPLRRRMSSGASGECAGGRAPEPGNMEHFEPDRRHGEKVYKG
jgi:hypothetical protein